MTKDKKDNRHSELMAYLAQSGKLAKDTLNRVKSKMSTTNDTKAVTNSSHRSSWNWNPVSLGNVEDLLEVESGSDAESERLAADDKHQNMSSWKTAQDQVANIHEPLPVTKKALNMVSYYMDRISYQCQNHYSSIPPASMSKADRLHCCRFHKHLLKKS